MNKTAVKLTEITEIFTNGSVRAEVVAQSWYTESPYYLARVIDSVVLDKERVNVLQSIVRHTIYQTPGEIWECGVYRGGTAGMLAHLIKDLRPNNTLRLFDTFTGFTGTLDSDLLEHEREMFSGTFNDTSANIVINKIKAILPDTNIHIGYIPDTFIGLENCEISFAHIDTDSYKSYIDCLNFIWPRLVLGGIIVFDDYGACRGAFDAVNEFFSDKKVKHIELDTIQAIVIKNQT